MSQMSQLNKALAVLVVAGLGLWGCAEGPGTKAAADRIKTLEQKSARLEDETRSLAAGREQLRLDLTGRLETAEAQKSQLSQDLEQHLKQEACLTRERDELTALRNALTKQRDALTKERDGLLADRAALTAVRNSLTGERDGLKATVEQMKAEIKSRIGEREAVQAQFEQFRKNLKDLLGQTEAALTSPAAQARDASASHPERTTEAHKS